MHLIVRRRRLGGVHQLWHHSLEHLSFCFERLQGFRYSRALQSRASASGEFSTPLTAFEGIIIVNDDLHAFLMSSTTSFGMRSRVLVIAICSSLGCQFTSDP